MSRTDSLTVWLRPELRIRTPEGITFAHPLAGPVSRAMAAAVDLVCVLFLSNLFTRALSWLALLTPDLAQGLTVILYFGVSIGYGVVLEWLWRGQTLGKRWLRLRVIDAGGLRLQFHQVLLRNLLRPVDLLPAFYLLGGLLCLMGSRQQRLGDLAAGTTVIFQPEPLEPDLEQLLAGKFNSLRAHSHLAARLRQAVPPALARLALQALLRRDELEAAARVALFGDLADVFKKLVRFPAEVSELLADEQYVRNVVDLLFRSADQEAGLGLRSTRDSF